MANRKRKNEDNDLQDIKQKNRDQVTLTSLKTGSELMCFGRVGSSLIN